MLDVLHWPSLHDEVPLGVCGISGAGGSSSSTMLASNILGSSNAAHLPMGVHRDELHATWQPLILHNNKFGRAAPSAFDVQGEEERREPTWPLMLVSYYKMKIKEMQRLAMKYALQKIEAERDAFRAHAAEQYANEEAENARKQAAEVDNGPEETIEQIEEKIVMQKPKQEAATDEVVSSTNLLDADDRRDQAMKNQIAAMQKELVYENKLRSAMAEQKMRAERRNLVPGVIAVDCSGRQIVTKRTCDAEPNTVYRDGECRVAGGQNPPESPTELAAADLTRDDEEAIEKAELDVENATKAAWQPRSAAKKAEINYKAAVAEMLRFQGRAKRDGKGAPRFFGKAPPDQQKKMDEDQHTIDDQQKLVDKLWGLFQTEDGKKQAAESKLKSAQDSELSARQKHLDDLKTLYGEEQKIEAQEVEVMKKDDEKIQSAHDSMDGAQKKLATSEAREAAVLKEEAAQLQKQSEQAEDASMARDFGKEAHELRKWEFEAERESAASARKDQETVAAENVAQKNAYFADKRAERDTERDQYANGEDVDERPLDPSDPDYASKKALREHDREVRRVKARLTAQQASENDVVKDTLKQEKDAFDSDIAGNRQKAAAEQDRNDTSLREAETQSKMKAETDTLSRRRNKPYTSSVLEIDVSGWPVQKCQGWPRPQSVAVLKAKLPLLLENSGPTALLHLPRRKLNLKRFL